jgi:hypothetical protein
MLIKLAAMVTCGAGCYGDINWLLGIDELNVSCMYHLTHSTPSFVILESWQCRLLNVVQNVNMNNFS